MSTFDCGRCGVRLTSETEFQDHRRDVHGIVPKEYPDTPMGSHEKNLNGHTRAEDIRRDPRRGKGLGGNRAVD